NLMEIGDDRFVAGDYEAALEAYRGADEIMGVPTTSLALGRAHLALGDLVEAVDAFGRARRFPERNDEPRAFRAARRDATRLDAETAQRIPTVTLRILGPAKGSLVRVRIDEATLEGVAL